MFGLSSLHGAGYFILQGLRVCTVISLAAAIAACWSLIIKVDMYKPYFVFQCISLCFTSFGCLFLIIAEFPVIRVVREFYETSIPFLSNSHGIGWLGGAMIIIGSHILGNLNQKGYHTLIFDNHFSKLVLAAGVLCILFGGLNIISALIWRDGKHGITSRDIRAHGSLAINARTSLPSYTPSPNGSVRNEKRRSKFMSMFRKREAEKTGRPVISGPMPTHQNHGQDIRTSPVAPGVERPPTAHHPINGGARPSSQYSVADVPHF